MANQRRSWAKRWLALRRDSATRLVVPVVVTVAVILGTHPDNPGAVGEWGLIAVAPWQIFAAVVVLSVSFALLLRRDSPSAVPLCAHLFALALLLHGLPSLLESEPRFSTAWLHAGFVSAIIEHKHPLGSLDARFSWPGFFTAMASVVGMSGNASALPFLRWTPLVSNVAYLLPLYVIARTLLASRIRAWITLWAFLLADWVGQDYFSPQGASYFLFLSILALLVYAFGDGRPPPGIRLLPTRLGALLTQRATAGAAFSYAQRAGLLLTLVAASAALTMSHQLTPVVLVVDVTALVLARQCSLRYFPLILLVLVAGWLSYGAVDYWSGHLSTLFGAGGSKSVAANVSQRVKGSSVHIDIVYLRVLFSAGVWVFGGLGAIIALRAGRNVNLTACLLAVVPFPLLLAQSYGGEAGLRLYFYTFPFWLILGVAALPEDSLRRSWRPAIALSLATPLVAVALLIARFGNEEFEQVRPDEVAAAERLYQLAPRGSSLVSITPNVIWRYRAFTAYTYRPNTLDEFELGTPQAILGVMGTNPLGSYLLISRAQTTYATVTYGLPADWGTHVEELLARQPQFRLVYENRDAHIYEVLTTPPPARQRVPH